MMIIYINLKIYKLLKIVIIKQQINLLKILKRNNKNKNKKDFFKKKVFIEFIRNSLAGDRRKYLFFNIHN